MFEPNLFIKRIGLVGATSTFVAMSTFILLPILTKNVSVEDYGIWVQITIAIGLVPSIVLLGMPYSMVRFLAPLKDKDDIAEGFYTILFINILMSTLASLLILFFTPTIANYITNNDEIIVELLAIAVFIEGLNTISFNYFRTFQQIKRYSIFMMIKTLLNIISIGFFIYQGFGIRGAIVGLIISNSIILFIILSLIVNEVGFKIPKFFSLKDYLIFGLPTIPGDLSSWILQSSNRFVIGLFLGASFVGYFSAGYTLANAITIFLAPLSFMLPAALSECYSDDSINEVKYTLDSTIKYFLAISIPATFGISILSRSILTEMTTPEIAAKGYIITPIVAVSLLILGVYTIATQIIILKMMTQLMLFIWVFGAALNFVLNLVMIPRIGLIGAAISMLIAYLTVLFSTLFYSNKWIRLDFQWGFILRCVISSLLMSLILMGLNPSGIFHLIGAVLLSVIIYFLLLYGLKGFDNKDIKNIKIFFKH